MSLNLALYYRKSRTHFATRSFSIFAMLRCIQCIQDEGLLMFAYAGHNAIHGLNATAGPDLSITPRAREGYGLNFTGHMYP
jgi:hypothetical protein